MRGNAQGLVCDSYRALSDTYTGSMHPRENSSARAKRVTDFLLRQVMPVAAASIGVRLAPSTSPVSEHMLTCEHGAGIFRGYAGVIILRLIVYWQGSCGIRREYRGGQAKRFYAAPLRERTSENNLLE